MVMYCVPRNQKRESEWLEQELQVAVSHQTQVLGTRLWPCAVPTNTGEPSLSSPTFYFNSATGI